MARKKQVKKSLRRAKPSKAMVLSETEFEVGKLSFIFGIILAIIVGIFFLHGL